MEGIEKQIGRGSVSSSRAENRHEGQRLWQQPERLRRQPNRMWFDQRWNRRQLVAEKDAGVSEDAGRGDDGRQQQTQPDPQ